MLPNGSPCEEHEGWFYGLCPRCWGKLSHDEVGACAAARSALGWTFRHAGRNDRGIDCVGLVMLVADRMGWSHDRFRDYPSGIKGDRVAEELSRRMTPVDSLRPGDVVLCRVKRLPAHVAIVSDRATLIHAAYGRGVVEHGIDDRWIARFVSAYRYNEVAHG